MKKFNEKMMRNLIHDSTWIKTEEKMNLKVNRVLDKECIRYWKSKKGMSENQRQKSTDKIYDATEPFMYDFEIMKNGYLKHFYPEINFKHVNLTRSCYRFIEDLPREIVIGFSYFPSENTTNHEEEFSSIFI